MELRSVAPSIAITTSREEDLSFRWDGDGPDPRQRGFRPYDVTVSVQAIIGGELVSAEAYLGGSYYRPNEPLRDIHGYLPQMIEEAVTELQTLATTRVLKDECGQALDFIRKVMQDEYDKQHGKRGKR